jgi:Trk K+ transport system NAD-binding subunit
MAPSIPDHRPVIVAGLGRLGLRLVQILRERGCEVRVITDVQVQPWHERQAREAGAVVWKGDFRDPEIWVQAGAAECQAAIVTSADDSRNLETSIRVKRLAPGLRMVTRVDAPHLGQRLQHDFGLHAALCPAALSAAHFVNAALDSSPAAAPAAATAKRPAISGRRAPLQIIVLALLSLSLITGTLVFHYAKGMSWVDAMYFTVTTLATVGFGDFNLQSDAAWLKVFGMLLMLAGVTLIALLVSLFSHFLITGEATRHQHGRAALRQRRHVIVAGMGSLGSAVVRDLHGRGVSIVCVDSAAEPADIAAQHFRVPVITGDATEAETLLRAGIDRARAVMAVTSADGANLEIALRARTLATAHRPGVPLPVIIACQDELLGARLRSADNDYHPLSSADIAAPVLADAALGHSLTQQC